MKSGKMFMWSFGECKILNVTFWLQRRENGEIWCFSLRPFCWWRVTYESAASKTFPTMLVFAFVTLARFEHSLTFLYLFSFLAGGALREKKKWGDCFCRAFFAVNKFRVRMAVFFVVENLCSKTFSYPKAAHRVRSSTIRPQAFCGPILLPFSEKVNHRDSNVSYSAYLKCAGKYWSWRIQR